MKKLCAWLLVLGVLLALPLDVFADDVEEEVEGSSAIVIPSKPDKKVDNGDGTYTYYYSITMNNDGYLATEPTTEATITFNYGPAIKSFECAESDNYVATKTIDSTGTVCVYKAKSDGVTAKEISIGTVVVVVNKDAKDEDCSIEYMYNGSKGTVNTGSSVPYIMITGGIVLGAAAYFATKKKAKMQRI